MTALMSSETSSAMGTSRHCPDPGHAVTMSVVSVVHTPHMPKTMERWTGHHCVVNEVDIVVSGCVADLSSNHEMAKHPNNEVPEVVCHD